MTRSEAMKKIPRPGAITNGGDKDPFNSQYTAIKTAEKAFRAFDLIIEDIENRKESHDDLKEPYRSIQDSFNAGLDAAIRIIQYRLEEVEKDEVRK